VRQYGRLSLRQFALRPLDVLPPRRFAPGIRPIRRFLLIQLKSRHQRRNVLGRNVQEANWRRDKNCR